MGTGSGELHYKDNKDVCFECDHIVGFPSVSPSFCCCLFKSCVCLCVCVCVRACVRACVCMCVCGGGGGGVRVRGGKVISC